jgi:N-acetylglucosaminyldiphosphoundecaprenol N-acetyl-beta-D-mannosaminyltransferase
MATAIDVMGIRVHSMSADEIVATIGQTIERGERTIVANVNAHALKMALEQPDFARFLNNEADYVFCDGFGVKLAAFILGKSVQYRCTPPDWIDNLCAACAEHGYTLYLLGAEGDTAERAAHRQMEKHPNLQVVGWHDGYFNKAQDHPENQAIVDYINQLKPNILLVGFGMPLQEQWLSENWDRLEAQVALPVGALFDYMVGNVYRAPRWITDHGLEWLARLVIEPRRLWRRYVIGLPVLFSRVLVYRLFHDRRSQQEAAARP